MPVMHIINKLYGDWEIAQFINRLPCRHENLGPIPRKHIKKKKPGCVDAYSSGGRGGPEKRGSCWPSSIAEQVAPGQETLSQNTRCTISEE